MLSSLSSTIRTVLAISAPPATPTWQTCWLLANSRLAPGARMGRMLLKPYGGYVTERQTPMAKPGRITRKIAETLAIQALGLMAADPERLGQFLAATGIGPEMI